MSSISSLDSSERKSPVLNATGTDHGDANGFAPFIVAGLASHENVSKTGMREEAILLAWLIVLLRTHEGDAADQVLFDWAYNCIGNSSTGAAERSKLSIKGLSCNLQSTLEECMASISHDLSKAPLADISRQRETSLLLSTRTLSRNCEDIQDSTVCYFHEVKVSADQNTRRAYFTSRLTSTTVASRSIRFGTSAMSCHTPFDTT